MKRGYFFLVLLALGLLFFYSPVTTGQNAECFSSGDNVIQNSAGEIPSKFFYENQETRKWKFEVNDGDVLLNVPIHDGEKWLDNSLHIIESALSNENCRYYSFEFRRETRTLNYQLPANFNEPRNINNELICEYSIAPIERDIDNILGLGGRALELVNVCPSAQNKILPEGTTECPETVECDVDINEGETVYYGFSLEKDLCGNVSIEEDNYGNSISQGEIQSRAEIFVNDCLSRKARGSAAARVSSGAEPGTSGGGSSGPSSSGGGGIGGAGGSRIGCTTSNSQPSSAEPTYCEGYYSNLQLSPEDTNLQGCACEKIKNPKSQADCDAGKCDRAVYCKFKKGGWISSDSCKCEGCGGKFSKDCGDGSCAAGESCCGGQMCCDQQGAEPVCVQVAGKDDKAFCQPQSCPPPRQPEKTVSCNLGYIEIPKVLGSNKVTNFLTCCPQGTTCAYQWQDIPALVKTKSVYCVKTQCEQNEFECGTNADLGFVGGQGKFCCPKGNTCKKLSKLGLFQYKCVETSCPSGQELCRGLGDSSGWDICCPTGKCNVHPNGVPDCR